MGGLALLAEHLPAVYPETVRAPVTEKSTSDQLDSDWIKIEGIPGTFEISFYSKYNFVYYRK